jgi:transposase
VVLTGGEVSDIRACGPVMAEPGPAPKVLLGDKGYDADAILEDLAARGVAAVIPPRRHRKVQPVIDGCLYAPRNLVERCFSKLKHSRRLQPAGPYRGLADGLRRVEWFGRHLIQTSTALPRITPIRSPEKRVFTSDLNAR